MKVLNRKDIAKIDRKAQKEKDKRAKFESHTEVYMVNTKKMTYAILWPVWPFKSIKFWRLRYYEFSMGRTYTRKNFRKYKDFKLFLKEEELRGVSEFEAAKLKSLKQYREHFKVTEVENIELSQEDLEWLKKM